MTAPPVAASACWRKRSPKTWSAVGPAVIECDSRRTIRPRSERERQPAASADVPSPARNSRRVTVARTASLCRRSLNGGYGGNGVHKRRNGENGGETEKRYRAARAAASRLAECSAPPAPQFELSARRSEDRRGCECEPASQASGRAGDACDVRLSLAPDRAARGADSRESVSSARCLLRFASVDSVSPFVNSVSSVPSVNNTICGSPSPRTQYGA